MKYKSWIKHSLPFLINAGLMVSLLASTAKTAPTAKSTAKTRVNTKFNTIKTPEQFFKAYYDSLKMASSTKAIEKHLSTKHSPINEHMLEQIQADSPFNIRITKQIINDNDATIVAEGIDNMPIKHRAFYGGCQNCPPAKYQVFFLVKENGKWKIDGDYRRNIPFPFIPKNIFRWREWADQAATTKPSTQALHGKFNGQGFELLECSITKEKDGFLLAFQSKPMANKQGTNNIQIRIEGYTGKLANQHIQIMPGGEILFAGKQLPIYITRSVSLFNTEHNPERIGPDLLVLNLELGSPEGSTISGSIVLRSESQPETWLDGIFTAKLK